jgi:ubiquinone biosynthesis protein
MIPLRFHLAYKNFKRLRVIVTVLTRHGFRPLMERLRLTGILTIPQRIAGRSKARKESGLTAAERARAALEELGPTFIKFGQIISTRPDIIPEDFITELLKLQDSVAPIPFPHVLSVIESEFKRPINELYLSIDETPIAAASIAQVHRAVTMSGEEAVVKVQRPGIEETIDTDITILGYIARLAVKYIPESRLYDPEGVVEEFSRTIKKEMDFTLEASYTERFRQNFSDDPRVTVPKVFWELTGKNVLTMERIHGIKIDRLDKLREAGVDTVKIAHLVVDTFFKQVFDFGLFHGDLHSGNIFVISDEKIALVDFGIVGRIDPVMKQYLADILISFVKGDFEGLTRIYQKMGILPETIDRASFEREYYDIMLHYFGRPFKSVRIGELLMDYIRLAARHNITLPRDLLLFDKCLLELEGLSRLLYPDVNILKESEPYAAKLYLEKKSPKAVIEDAVTVASDYGELFHNLPAQTVEIMKKVLDDKLRIEFMHKGLEEFMGEMDRSSNRLTFGIIVAALVVGSSLVIASETAPKIAGYAALGIMGFVVASLLGLWLALQILRSGKF